MIKILFVLNQRLYKGKIDNSKTLNALKEMLDFQVQGVEVKVNGKVIGIAQNHEVVTQVMN
ncbi:hypothetical protein [Tepidibacillus marianensis]|uniref:hypothetical protein n=1 Tax=Tepidibacillus marianensis TaxID=3131995 RepID=UPI0030CD8A45